MKYTIAVVLLFFLFGCDQTTDDSSHKTTSTSKDVGEMVISPVFRFASEFKEGLASVADNITGNYGFINSRGEWAINPTFAVANSFSEGLASFSNYLTDTPMTYGYINAKGEIEIEPIYSFAGQFSNGMARVQIGADGKWGFIDRNGVFKIPPIYDFAQDITEDLAAVQYGRLGNDRFGFIDKEGKVVISPEFNFAKPFSDGLSLVTLGNRLHGYIDKTGNMVIAPIYSYATSFVDGFAQVIDPISQRLVYINQQGKVVSFSFSYQRGNTQKLSTFQVGNGEKTLWGFIDADSKIVINPQYKTAFPFSEGLAAVQLIDTPTGRGLFGFIKQ
jgi:hypothetical protein